jgi:hypothetical protein
VNHVSPGEIFAGTWRGGVFLSSNNGTSWTQSNSGISGTNISSLLVNGSNIFAGTWASGIFLTTNNGSSWKEINTGLPARSSILSITASGSDIFAGTDGGGVWLRPLSSVIYIVDSITCRNFYHHFHCTNGSYNEIKNCKFTGMYDSLVLDWRASTLEGNAAYNWIHNNIFEHYGNFEGRDDQGVLFEIGWEDGTNDGTDFNVIENNSFQMSGHHIVGVAGQRNVIRNNYMQNDEWYKSGGKLYGDRVLSLVGMPGDDQQNLIEGNRVAFGGHSGETDQMSGEGCIVSESYCILRYNEFIRSDLMAIYVDPHNEGKTANYNCIYHNTFWHNGYTVDTLITSNKERRQQINQYTLPLSFQPPFSPPELIATLPVLRFQDISQSPISASQVFYCQHNKKSSGHYLLLCLWYVFESRQL